MTAFLVQHKGFAVFSLILFMLAGLLFFVSFSDGRYGAAISALFVPVLLIILVISVHSESKKPLSDRLHPWKPWKLPYITTSRGLWLRAGFSSLVILTVCSSSIILFRLLDGDWSHSAVTWTILSLLSPLYFYSLYRRRYESTSGTDKIGTRSSELRHMDEPVVLTPRQYRVIASIIFAVFVGAVVMERLLP